MAKEVEEWINQQHRNGCEVRIHKVDESEDHYSIYYTATVMNPMRIYGMDIAFVKKVV